MNNPKATHWCFTLNNYTDLDIARCAVFFAESCKYLIYGKEVGESGTPHLQGYFCLKNQKTLTALKKVFATAHFEVKRGTVTEAVVYCKKDGDYLEFGNLPEERGTAGGAANADRWAVAKNLAISGKLDDVDPEIFIRYYSSIKKIADDRKLRGPIKTLDWINTPNIWIWGKTGVGKSRRARELGPDAYLKNRNKWWDGYADEEDVIIDDFGQGDTWMGDYLKTWSDRYPFKGETKGSTVTLRPKRIILTSNYSPDDLWSDVGGVLEPLRRRFKVMHLEKLEDADVIVVEKPILKRNNAVLFVANGEEEDGIVIEEEPEEEIIVVDEDVVDPDISIKSTSKKRRCNKK